jgi:hypothetical protein
MARLAEVLVIVRNRQGHVVALVTIHDNGRALNEARMFRRSPENERMFRGVDTSQPPDFTRWGPAGRIYPHRPLTLGVAAAWVLITLVGACLFVACVAVVSS